jgi:ketosteroid isomerase-like protein
MNAGNLEALMMLYEPEACFAFQLDQIVKDQQSVRQNLQGFIDMKGKFESKIKRVLQTRDLALVISEWSFKGTGTDGNPVNLTGTATDVLHQQSDSTWRIIIDNPWETV